VADFSLGTQGNQGVIELLLLLVTFLNQQKIAANPGACGIDFLRPSFAAASP
jgi:hypothetical protein